jgi:hypothetical protein
VEPPEDAVDDASVILQGPTATAVMPRLWQERRETFPLPVREFVAVSQGWSPERTPIAQAELRLFSTTRQWAKEQENLEATSKACMQAFGASTTRKRLEDKPMEALRFSTGF